MARLDFQESDETESRISVSVYDPEESHPFLAIEAHDGEGRSVVIHFDRAEMNRIASDIMKAREQNEVADGTDGP